MKEIIIISPKFGKKIIIVDNEDYEYLSNFSWYIRKEGNNFYAARHQSVGPGKYKKIRLHRDIMYITDSKILIDHINGNTLDNRKENLRICLHKNNMKNSKMQKNNKSGYKGVYWNKRAKYWYTQICFDYKRITLGKFETKEHAATAYNELALKYHGEFARLNIIKREGKE